MSERERLKELIAKLRQQRDELAVQMHLGKAELKEEWNRLDERLSDLLRKYEPVREAAGETAEGVWTGLKLIADEIQQGFRRVRDKLK